MVPKSGPAPESNLSKKDVVQFLKEFVMGRERVNSQFHRRVAENVEKTL